MKDLRMVYNKEADVLYVSFGKPKKAVGEEIASGVIKRVDPKSKKTVGYTIIGISSKKEIKVPIVA